MARYLLPPRAVERMEYDAQKSPSPSWQSSPCWVAVERMEYNAQKGVVVYHPRRGGVQTLPALE